MSLRILVTRLLAGRRRRSDSDIDEELAAHLEMAAAELRDQGMSAEAAEREARLRFGGITQQREAYRKQSRPPLIDSIVADLRYAARQLRHNPGFATVTVLTLALGIGATTAIYSLVQAVLLHSLPYGHPDQLVYLYTPLPQMHLPVQMFGPSSADLRDIRRESHSFTHVTAFGQTTFNLATSTIVERVNGAKVDARFFDTLESPALLGRTIDAHDNQPGNEHVAVISYSLWHLLFTDGPEVLNRSIILNGSAYRIVGVMPQEFDYPTTDDFVCGDACMRKTDVWIPLALTPQQAADRDDANLNAIARLKPGVSIPSALAEMSVIMRHLDTLHSAQLRGWSAAIESFRDTTVGPVRPLLWLLLGAVCCVLLVASGNAANLLLARAAARSHEFGVRATLGAGRLRVVRQLLTESLLLSAIAGVAGVGLAWLFLRFLLRLDPGDIPRLQQASLNPWVLLFSAAITLLACMFFGTLPAIATSRISPNILIKTGRGRSVVSPHSRGRSLLMTVEVSLVVFLLAGTGLFLRSFQRVLAAPAGFIPSTVTFHVQADPRYTNGQDGLLDLRRLMDRFATIPGVRAAGADYRLPLSNTGSMSTVWVEGSRNNRKDQLVIDDHVTPGFFTAMGTTLIGGRFFSDADGPGSNVVIVNQSFARHYFPDRQALGGHIRGAENSDAPWKTIVGIVGDVRGTSMEKAAEPATYWPLWHDPSAFQGSAFFAIRSFLPPDKLIPSLGAAARSVDATVALSDVQTMEQAIAASTARRRFQTTLLGIFAGAALLLALIGLYGLLAYSVRQRVPEIGVRIALGASRARVIGMVVRQGLRLVTFGLIIGLAVALACVHLLTGMLYGVRTYDPVTFVGAPIFLVLAALVACGVPAWHAAHIEPSEALRAE